MLVLYWFKRYRATKKKCITVSSVVMVPKLYWEGYRIKMDLA